MKKMFLLCLIGVFGLFGFQSPAQDTLISDTVEVGVKEKSEAIALDSRIFKNLSGKGKPESIELSWSIDYEAFPEIAGDSLIVAYITSINLNRLKAGYSDAKWFYSEVLPVEATSYTLEGLQGAEKYKIKIGLAQREGVWANKISVRTERGWGIVRLFILIGALAMFMYGMKTMSEGMQTGAGAKLRNMLASITSNRFKGVFTGFGITSIVQSSSVTTVMTVSFVNAGLMTLRESAGVMMGANIGTTITGWLILILGFKVSVSSYALVIMALGLPFLFMTRGKSKAAVSAIFGFGLLFLGLSLLKEAVPDLDKDSGLVQFFVQYKDAGLGATLMFIGLGALVTIVVQSSSAAMALTMALVAKGIIPFEVACAMILGENIGTTITAELASLIGNVHAKRSARIHSMFNIVGVTWMVLVYSWFLQGLTHFIQNDPFTDPVAANTGLALFHTTFNLANVLLLVWFVPQLVSLAERTVKSKGELDEEFHLEYISAGTFSTPDMSIAEAKKEVSKFGKIASKMSAMVQKLLTEQDKKEKSQLHARIRKYEEITDRVEIEIADYLGKVSTGEMSDEASLRVRGMLSMANDLERIGDIFFQMSKTIERKEEEEIWFTPEQRESIKDLFFSVDKSLEIMHNNLQADYESVSINQAMDCEREINTLRNEIRKRHLQSIEKGEYNIKSGMVYNDLFSSLEKVGDHVINVTEAIVGNV